MAIIADIFHRIFNPDRDEHAVPVLDGGFAANQRLEDASELAQFDAPDAMALAPDGKLFVSAGTSIWVCETCDFSSRSVFATVDGHAGAIVLTRSGELLVAVAGQGVLAFDMSGKKIGQLALVDDAPLACVTSLAVADDGTVYLTDGSRHNDFENWVKDLMEQAPGSGRIIAANADLSAARVLADGLAWPGGIALNADQTALLVTEAWSHRLLSMSRHGGDRKAIVGNFAGYPGRISPCGDGTFLIAFLTLRTQLVEFILRERGFCKKMMREIPPRLWVAPSLGGSFHCLEPTQLGQMRKLGIHKPWAPARSYGLVARLNERGRAIESMHSRAAGTRHGIMQAIADHGRVLALSKGHGKLVSVPMGEVAGEAC